VRGFEVKIGLRLRKVPQDVKPFDIPWPRFLTWILMVVEHVTEAKGCFIESIHLHHRHQVLIQTYLRLMTVNTCNTEGLRHSKVAHVMYMLIVSLCPTAVIGLGAGVPRHSESQFLRLCTRSTSNHFGCK